MTKPLKISATLLAALLLAALLLATAGPLLRHASAQARIRPPVALGAWYPANPARLFQAVQQYVTDAAEPDRPGRVLAMVVPNAAYPFAGETAGHPFSLLKPGQYDRVVVMTPSHHATFRGCSLPAVDFYRTPLGDVPCDTEAVRALARKGGFQRRSLRYDDVQGRQPLHEVEHGIEVLLPFLQVQLGEFRLVPIVMGSLTDRAGGIDAHAERSVVQGLASVLDERTLLVISTNFTHYGYEYNFVPFQTDVSARVRALDFGAIDSILDKDVKGLERYFDETGNKIPGRLPLRILLQLLPQRAAGTVLAYDTSGNVTGDWESSVSYAGIAFFDPGAPPLEQKPVRTLVTPRPGPRANDRAEPQEPADEPAQSPRPE